MPLRGDCKFLGHFVVLEGLYSWSQTPLCDIPSGVGICWTASGGRLNNISVLHSWVISSILQWEGVMFSILHRGSYSPNQVMVGTSHPQCLCTASCWQLRHYARFPQWLWLSVIFSENNRFFFKPSGPGSKGLLSGSNIICSATLSFLYNKLLSIERQKLKDTDPISFNIGQRAGAKFLATFSKRFCDQSTTAAPFSNCTSSYCFLLLVKPSCNLFAQSAVWMTIIEPQKEVIRLRPQTSALELYTDCCAFSQESSGWKKWGAKWLAKRLRRSSITWLLPLLSVLEWCLLPTSAFCTNQSHINWVWEARQFFCIFDWVSFKISPQRYFSQSFGHPEEVMGVAKRFAVSGLRLLTLQRKPCSLCYKMKYLMDLNSWNASHFLHTIETSYKRRNLPFYSFHKSEIQFPLDLLLPTDILFSLCISLGKDWEILMSPEDTALWKMQTVWLFLSSTEFINRTKSKPALFGRIFFLKSQMYRPQICCRQISHLRPSCRLVE